MSINTISLSIFTVRILTLLLAFMNLAYAESLSYEKCTTVNSYLESGIGSTLKIIQQPNTCTKSQTPFQIVLLTEIVNSPMIQDLKCIKAAQENANFKKFVSCASATSPETTGKPKPCVSVGSVELVTRAFKLASHCVGLNEREMFALFNHESGMLLNVKSDTGAAGPAQLTPSAIKDYRELYEVYKDRKLAAASDLTMMDIELRSKNTECAIFETPAKGALVMKTITPNSLLDILPPVPENNQDCGTLAFPRNPLMSFYWGMANYKVSRDVMLSSINAWNKKRTKKLSSTEIEKLVIGLSRIAYNGGRDTVLNLFTNYRTGVSAETTSADQILNGFSTYLATNYSPGDSARKQEVALYYQKTVSNLNQLEKLSGPCFASPFVISSSQKN